jgi:hypothetical protein
LRTSSNACATSRSNGSPQPGWAGHGRRTSGEGYGALLDKSRWNWKRCRRLPTRLRWLRLQHAAAACRSGRQCAVCTCRSGWVRVSLKGYPERGHRERRFGKQGGSKATPSEAERNTRSACSGALFLLCASPVLWEPSDTNLSDGLKMAGVCRHDLEMLLPCRRRNEGVGQMIP